MKITKRQLRRIIREELNRTLSEGDPFDDMDSMFDDMDSPSGAGDDSHYPENRDAIPGVVEKMNAELEALGPRPSDLRERSRWSMDRMDVFLKFGMVRQDNNYYTFRLRSGGETRVDK